MLNKPMRALVLMSPLLVVLAGFARPEPQQHIIGIGLARRILTAALESSGITKRAGFDLEYYDGKDPRFYFFAAEWDTPKSSAAGGVGHYAVNRVTGDVWEVMGCDRVTSRRAEKLRARILKWTKPGKGEYERAKGFTPCP